MRFTKLLFSVLVSMVLFFAIGFLSSFVFGARNSAAETGEESTAPDCIMGPGNCGCYLDTQYCQYQYYKDPPWPADCPNGTWHWKSLRGRIDIFQNGRRIYADGEHLTTTCLPDKPDLAWPDCLGGDTCY